MIRAALYLNVYMSVLSSAIGEVENLFCEFRTRYRGTEFETRTKSNFIF
jgi:hypothetical protein